MIPLPKGVLSVVTEKGFHTFLHVLAWLLLLFAVSGGFYVTAVHLSHKFRTETQRCPI